jgi:hypothetical protein
LGIGTCVSENLDQTGTISLLYVVDTRQECFCMCNL